MHGSCSGDTDRLPGTDPVLDERDIFRPATFNSSTRVLNIPVYPARAAAARALRSGHRQPACASHVASGTAVSGVNRGVTINQHTVAPVLAMLLSTQTSTCVNRRSFTSSGAMTGNITRLWPTRQLADSPRRSDFWRNRQLRAVRSRSPIRVRWYGSVLRRLPP